MKLKKQKNGGSYLTTLKYRTYFLCTWAFGIYFFLVCSFRYNRCECECTVLTTYIDVALLEDVLVLTAWVAHCSPAAYKGFMTARTNNFWRSIFPVDYRRPRSLFSLKSRTYGIRPLYLNIYIANIYLGSGFEFEFGLQRIRDLSQKKMNRNKLKPKSPNLNPFICQPDPIGPVLGSWWPTWPLWTQKMCPKLGWTQKTGRVWPY